MIGARIRVLVVGVGEGVGMQLLGIPLGSKKDTMFKLGDRCAAPMRERRLLLVLPSPSLMQGGRVAKAVCAGAPAWGQSKRYISLQWAWAQANRLGT